MIKLTNQNLCDAVLPNRTVRPTVAWGHVKGSGHRDRRLCSKSCIVRKEGRNRSAQTANPLPYLKRLHQHPRYHSLHNRKLHKHCRYTNCFIVPTLRWTMSRDWVRRRFGHWVLVVMIMNISVVTQFNFGKKKKTGLEITLLCVSRFQFSKQVTGFRQTSYNDVPTGERSNSII